MRSPMVDKGGIVPEAEKSGYSELKVLSSAAGFYVGTTYYDAELKFSEPGSRDSDYFATAEQAQAHLDTLNKLEAAGADVTPLVRMTP